MEVKKVKLKEVCTVNQGLQIPISKRYKEKGTNRYFYITIQFLKGNTDEYYIENPKNSVICTKEDILVVRTGSTGVVVTNVEGCFHNNFFKVVPNEKVDRKYLYYVLNNKDMYKKMLNAASGTTIPDLKHSAFYDLEIPLPSIENQIKIAKILQSIDDKIKLNNCINANLQKIIECLYDKYLQECNEKQAKEYDAVELLDFIQGIEPGSKNYKTTKELNDINFYRVGDMNEECKTYIDKELAKNRILSKKDIVMSFDATIGRIAYGLEGAYSTGIKKVTAKNIAKIKLSSAFIFAYLNSKEIQEILKENARGTTILHASSAIEYFKIKIDDSIYEFMNNVDNYFDKMLLIKSENKQLNKLQEILLPKLMNGEIDLENAKI